MVIMRIRKLTGGRYIASYFEGDELRYERIANNMKELKKYISRGSSSTIEFDSSIPDTERSEIIHHYYRIS